MSNDIAEITNKPDGLTELQAKLCEEMVLNGRSKTDAITAAGYTATSGGYAALKKDHVKQYLAALIRDHLLESSIKAIRQIDSLITGAKSEYVQLEASRDVLDRAGFKPIEKHAHLHGGAVDIKIDLG